MSVHNSSDGLQKLKSLLCLNIMKSTNLEHMIKRAVVKISAHEFHILLLKAAYHVLLILPDWNELPRILFSHCAIPGMSLYQIRLKKIMVVHDKIIKCLSIQCDKWAPWPTSSITAATSNLVLFLNDLNFSRACSMKSKFYLCYDQEKGKENGYLCYDHEINYIILSNIHSTWSYTWEALSKRLRASCKHHLMALMQEFW
jgi:hypothetical protein